MEEKIHRARVLIVSYPSEGHINPIFQFAKRLTSKVSKSLYPQQTSFTNPQNHYAFRFNSNRHHIRRL